MTEFSISLWLGPWHLKGRLKGALKGALRGGFRGTLRGALRDRCSLPDKKLSLGGHFGYILFFLLGEGEGGVRGAGGGGDNLLLKIQGGGSPGWVGAGGLGAGRAEIPTKLRELIG